MGKIPRNGDGLVLIQKHWEAIRTKKMDDVQGGMGNSNFLLDEIKKINDILKILDDFWEYIVHTNTGNYEDMIANNAEALVKEIGNNIDTYANVETGLFTPTNTTEPQMPKRILHQGDKAVYIEENNGIINIS